MYGNSERRSPLYKMIMLLLGLLLPASTLVLAAGSASAEDSTDQVCQGLDSGKIDTTGDPKTVTLTAPDGKLIDGYCVKAGSENSGDGPVYVTVDPPVKTLTISYPGGKDISHYSVSYTDAPSCTTHPNTPGCVTPPDACPNMPGTQPPGTVCTTPPPPVPPTPTPEPELKPVKVVVKKADKCGPNNSYYVKPVKGAYVTLFGKKVREGVWHNTKRSRLVLKAKVGNSEKFELVGKDKFVLVFSNDAPCHDTPDVTPPAGG